MNKYFTHFPHESNDISQYNYYLKVLFNFLQQRPDSCNSTQEALQDVDDWDLTEPNPDWDIGEGDVSSPLPQV